MTPDHQQSTASDPAASQNAPELHSFPLGSEDLRRGAREERARGWYAHRHKRSIQRWARAVADDLTIDDLRKTMERRVPPVIREYFRGGADTEQTLRDNIEAFQRVRLNPSYAVKVEPDLSTTVLGQKISMPVIAAPVGSLRLLWPRGEAVAAKAVGEARTIVALSTLTGTRLEEVKDAAQGPCWYQLYLVGGRNAALRGIESAKEAGYSALVLTIDTPVAGNRVGHAHMKPMDAISGNLKQKAKFGPQMMHHLSWLTSFKADGGAMKFANVILDDGSTMPYADIGAQLRQSAVTWEDVKWIKKAWGDRPIIIKGVHNLKDARLAEQNGASAIVISNHGGRQLDRVLPTLHILKEVAPRLKAEQSKMEIFMDGGVRSGSDVVIARALGARAVLVGRAYAYGLGAGGEAGVKRAFDILRKEIDDTMRQLGCAKLDDLEPSQHLRPYPFFGSRRGTRSGMDVLPGMMGVTGRPRKS